MDLENGQFDNNQGNNATNSENKNMIINMNIENEKLDNNKDVNNYTNPDNKNVIINMNIENKRLDNIKDINNITNSENKIKMINMNIENERLDNNKDKNNIIYSENKNMIGNMDIENNNLNKINIDIKNNIIKDKKLEAMQGLELNNNINQENLNNFNQKDAQNQINSQKEANICGINNLGNNCYLNSGLQILASCYELINTLNKNKNSKFGKIVTLFKKAMKSLLNESIYNPKDFINYFCTINKDFTKGNQCCSQNFIRTLIKNINNDYIVNGIDIINRNEQFPNNGSKEYKEYEKFIETIYPESKIISLFSGITKSHSYGFCPKCNNNFDDYSFGYFIDQNLYLDEFNSKCNFIDILDSNLGNENNLIMNCTKCNQEINLKEETKIIKLPEILIFTLERYQGETNNINIIPDEIIDMKKYIDESLKIENTKYQLFAVNIRLGKNINFGHEICQVKRNGIWYEINDLHFKKIKNLSHFDSSYGLFYRKNKNEQEKYIPFEENDDDVEENDNGHFKKTKNLDNNNIKKEESNECGFCFWDNSNKTDKKKICSIKNLKNNYYINCGLHIISLFDKFRDELNKYNIKDKSLITLLSKAIKNVLNEEKYEPNEFIEKFLKINKDFERNNDISSLDFILTLIKNINSEFIDLGFNLMNINDIKYIPERNSKEFKDLKKEISKQSNAWLICMGLFKSYAYGICKCNNIIDAYKYDSFIYKKINLDNFISDSYFSDILERNLTNYKNLSFICPKCKKEMKLNIDYKFIKLPEIFIFKLDRFKNETNKINVIPDEKIDLSKYIDKSLIGEKTKYELFAISIKLGKFGPEICHIKKNKNWYEINDIFTDKRRKNYYSDIYGLFYKKI